MQTLLSEGEAQPEAMQPEQCCRQGHQQYIDSLSPNTTHYITHTTYTLTTKGITHLLFCLNTFLSKPQVSQYLTTGDLLSPAAGVHCTT